MPDVTPSAIVAPHPTLPRYYENDGARAGFVRRIFDAGAADYDRIERMMALGSGSWYRRMALRRAGLVAGMRVLDVAIGTGLVAREEVGIVGDPARVLGVDPSAGMLAEAVRNLSVRVVMGRAERLPLADGHFDFLSMGYALRHIADLSEAFAEFHRAVRPGGTVCILEITRPQSRVAGALLRQYMRYIVPALARLTGRRAESPMLWEYFWDTIAACVPPERVIAALEGAGFADVTVHKDLGIFSQYTARKPS
jgi:demethylmenaquinone methyltransferase / 2-methoxy-6-polyprenyl-1,4-benzoquinol methylase